MVDVTSLTLTTEESQFLQHPAVGAVILFSRNFESVRQVSELITQIKAVRSPALLIAVDQEGGRVQRFRDGFFELPPLHIFGAQYDRDPAQAEQQAFNAARLMAAELRRVDVDFSFAPVLDVADLASSVIGDRAFHQNPNAIARVASAYIDGMNSVGMQATGKHFPGHGGVLADSHFEIPADNRDLETLLATDLLPYSQLSEKLGAVMTAHVSFPKVTDQLPTFSPFWIGQVLRQTIGFDGLVFSDDLTMQGARANEGSEPRVNLALAAGCDMVLICNAPEDARRAAEKLGDQYRPRQSRLEKMVAGSESISPEEIARLSDGLANFIA